MRIGRAVLAGLGAVAALAAGGCQKKDPSAAVAWVRLPAVPGRPAAAYFTLTGGARDDRLVRVESALARSAELHESMGGGMGGMSTMRPLDGIALPAGGRVALAPGGRHVMLIGLDPAVKAGTAVPLRLGFASGRTAEAEAKSVNAGDPAPY